MVNNMAAKGRIKLKVYLDENGCTSEVFVSPTTKCKDIVQRLQRKIRKSNCCLVEVWQGCERLVPEDEVIHSTLLEWDTDLDDVIFFLRPNEEAIAPRLLESDDLQIIEDDLPLPPPPDPSLLVIHNDLNVNNTNSLMPRNNGLSLEELQQLASRQQQEIALKERQLADKEQQLRELKQQTRQKIKSSYVDQLEAQIQEQDRKMRHLRQLQDQIEQYRVSNTALDAELQSMEVHFNSKEHELAIAAAKVDGLTEQLNHQREKWNKQKNMKQKDKDEKELNRLRQELMTRNELNHQQSVQLQAQKKLLAEKHKELFNLDSQIDQLTEELRNKKSQNSMTFHSHPMYNGSIDYHDNDNALWENGESFDWSEFTNAEDKYDEEVYTNYNGSDVNDHTGARQENTRQLETLVEVDETSSVTYSKTSSADGSSNGDPFSPHSGPATRVSKLASFFDREVTDQGSSNRKNQPVKSTTDSHIPGRGERTGPKNQQASVDSVLNSKTLIGSSPLSSPSSLSSLSSFSSSSSLSKSLIKSEDYRAPENVLKSREVKTQGMETSAVPTFQEKPRTIYEARVYDYSRNIDKRTVPTPIEIDKVSLNQTPPLLKEHHSESAKKPDGARMHQTLHSVDGPSENLSRSQTVTSVTTSVVSASPMIRDILTREEMKKSSGSSLPANAEPQSTLNENISQHTSPGKHLKPLDKDYRTSPSATRKDKNDSGSNSQSKVSKVKITLVSSEKVPMFENKGEPLRDNATNNTPKSPNESRSEIRNDMPTRETGNHPKLLNNESKPVREPETFKTHATAPKSPNKDKFESWDGNKNREGKRTAKVRPVDSFNAKKVPVTFNREKNADSKMQKDEFMKYRQNNREREAQNSNRLDQLSPRQAGPITNKEKAIDKKKPRHVSLDPHAVLLDAAVEGELEQVKWVIRDVDDPSLANGDGITALHNAVCGNHEEVVQFLVEYGCDVNLPDSHGWTPLHCAAANNDIIIVQYLVENGACIFATTGLHYKTPVQCCERSLPGYKECAAYLEDIQTNFGVSNQGKVYALYAYAATEDDELSFSCGEELRVLRRGDNTEKEWWWARNSSGQLGYIPRNLFGMSPRVAPEV